MQRAVQLIAGGEHDVVRRRRHGLMNRAEPVPALRRLAGAVRRQLAGRTPQRGVGPGQVAEGRRRPAGLGRRGGVQFLHAGPARPLRVGRRDGRRGRVDWGDARRPRRIQHRPDTLNRDVAGARAMGRDGMFAPGVHQYQGRFRRVQVGPQFRWDDVGLQVVGGAGAVHGLITQRQVHENDPRSRTRRAYVRQLVRFLYGIHVTPTRFRHHQP